MAGTLARPPSRPRPRLGARVARQPRRARPGLAHLLLGLLGLVLLAFAAAAWSRRWVTEDAFIYFRIVENLLAGHGPVFNVGERVEAYTSPAWLALLAAADLLVPGGGLEWLAVALGLALSLAGLAAGGLGTMRLLSGARARATPLPLGLLVVAAVPPFWDYATSGLETGLVFAWLGGCWWGLVSAGTRRPHALALAIGLGPLVRPDLALFSATFLLALALGGPLRPRRLAGLLAAAGALPVAYELFRMGYFAALVPNTALAKEAGVAFWSRGAGYLESFLAVYWLSVPLVPLAAWGVASVARDRARLRSPHALPVAAAVAGGVLHALYVVRLGGDYMHARLLLPSLLGVLLPVAFVAAPRPVAIALAAAVGVWALVCATSLQAPSRAAGATTPWFDQRSGFTAEAGAEHPVTLADHARLPHSQPAIGWALRDLARGRPAVVVRYEKATRAVEGRVLPWYQPRVLPGAPPNPAARARVLAYTPFIGRIGYAAGPQVRIADRYGLADPLAARVELPTPRLGQPGHEKVLSRRWYLARFVAPGDVPARHRAYVAAARDALACPPLRELLAATSEPLTPGRFVANLGVAVRAHGLRFDPDPFRARAELCP